jgi:hypothetical protein
MKSLFKYLAVLAFIVSSQAALAQEPEMADVMRSEGKIYVVVGIILIVLSGLILYLFLQDRKINKLEEMINKKGQTK